MKVLVLGGSQFIGRAIVDELLDREHEVSVLNRGNAPLGIPRVTELVADRRDASQVSAVLSDRVDAVVDVSGIHPAMVKGVLPALAGIDPCRYVFISTAAVYDREREPLPFSETMSASGDALFGEYGADKAACETLLAQALGERLVNLRPSYVFGPRNNIDREQFIWARLLAGQPIFVPGAGDTRIQFTYVKTLAELAVLGCSGELPVGTYNVAEDTVCTFATYIDLLARTCGRAADVRHVQDASVSTFDYFPFAPFDLYLDLSAIQRTGLVRQRSLEGATAETYRWFSAHGGLDDRPTSVEAAWRRELT